MCHVFFIHSHCILPRPFTLFTHLYFQFKSVGGLMVTYFYGRCSSATLLKILQRSKISCLFTEWCQYKKVGLLWIVCTGVWSLRRVANTHCCWLHYRGSSSSQNSKWRYLSRTWMNSSFLIGLIHPSTSCGLSGSTLL